ncbi:MAG: DinB family protein [Gemmatimonadota bacterium]
MDTPEAALRDAVRSALPRLEDIPDVEARCPRAPGKWSRKEIVGHLIDSASNNHQRFVRAQLTNDLVCATYDQDAWVEAQRYVDADWHDLRALWSHYNLHLAHVMAACPPDARTRPRAKHNLHEVAFRAVPADQPTTLEFFMRDYVVHLDHHLAQIFDHEAMHQVR